MSTPRCTIARMRELIAQCAYDCVKQGNRDIAIQLYSIAEQINDCWIDEYDRAVRLYNKALKLVAPKDANK